MTIDAIEATLKRIGLDRYMLLLISTVLLASFLPAQGQFAAVLSFVTFWAVALLFFLYGAKLPTSEVLRGFVNWKLQISCLAATYLLFPLLSLGFAQAAGVMLPALVGLGFLYLGCLPSTVQSSIAFTSVSNGNVAGAVCAASVSNLIGVLATPLLFTLIVSADNGGGFGTEALWKLVQQILLPFVIGQFCRPLLGNWLNRNKKLTMVVDRGSILLIVYAAFSAGVMAGIWGDVGVKGVIILAALCLAFFFTVLAILWFAAHLQKMPLRDRPALLYCGSTKSLASGLPMAGVLFPAQDVALIALPLVLFHLLQLLSCAVISQNWRVPEEAG